MIANLLLIITTVLGQSGNCVCAKSSVVANNRCFCDNEADKISICLKSKNPTWPMLPATTLAANCPSPASDPTGFSTCIKNSIPKGDPKANEIVVGCVAETKAVGKATDGNVVFSSSSTTVTGTPGSMTGSFGNETDVSVAPVGIAVPLNSAVKNTAAAVALLFVSILL